MIPILLIFSLTVAQSKFNNGVQPGRIIYDSSGRIRGFSDVSGKDIILGAIIPVHSSSQGVCSDDLYLETVEYVEAFLYALDLINSDDTLIPNITVGYDIRDSCLSENVAVVEALDLTLESNSMGSQSEECTGYQNGTRTVSGIVGEQVSFISVPIASLLSLVQVPQVSYLSTSPLLNNREKYPYFYRTVPSDDQQAQVMIDIALHFGWTYVSAIYSDDLYGDPGIERFRILAEESGICIDLDEGISPNFEEEQYDDLIDQLLFNSTANVVILFSSLNQAHNLFERMPNISEVRHFLWITSDAVTFSPVIFPKYAELLSGSWGVIPLSDSDPSFVQYYSSLTPTNNKRNPWFIQYYGHFYNCTAGQSVNCLNSNSSITSNPDYASNQNSPLLIDAVYTFAHAIHGFINGTCDSSLIWNSTTGTCNGNGEEFSSQTLLKYLANVNFTSPTGNHIVFTDTGSIDGRYRIINYQFDHQNKYRFVDVGVWNELQLELNKTLPLQFGVDQNGNISHSVKSQCQQCPLGNIKVTVKASCCGGCSPCLGQNYTQENTTECSKCPDDMWGNDPLNGSDSCIGIKKSYPNPSYAWGVLSIVLSIATGIAAVIAIILSIFSWNTNIMKSSIRGQIIVLVVGAVLSSISTSFFVSEPSVGICLFQRISTWISTSLLLSPLLMIEVRIAWNLLLKKEHVKRKFMKSLQQMLVTFLLIAVQMSLTAISLLVVYPEVNKNIMNNVENATDHPILHLNCVSSPGVDIAQIVYHTSLLMLLVLLVLWTLKGQENVNEPKYIAVSSFLLSIIWVGFLTSYFLLDKESHSFAISIMLQLGAETLLICYLLPRLFLGLRGTVSNSSDQKPSKSAAPLVISVNLMSHVSDKAKKLTSDTHM